MILEYSNSLHLQVGLSTAHHVLCAVAHEGQREQLLDLGGSVAGDFARVRGGSVVDSQGSVLEMFRHDSWRIPLTSSILTEVRTSVLFPTETAAEGLNPELTRAVQVLLAEQVKPLYSWISLVSAKWIFDKNRTNQIYIGSSEWRQHQKSCWPRGWQ